MELISTKLSKSVKKLFNENKDELDDIILFGSLMKGKVNPNDIDILLIFKEKIDKTLETIFKKAINETKVELNSVTLQEFESEDFMAKEGIYLEGYSLITNEPINKKLGFFSLAFIKYSLDNIKGSKRTQFYYALNGRDGKTGFLKEIGAQRFSENIIICDYAIIEKIKDFFEQWEIKYELIPSLIPLRLKKIMLNK